MTDRFIDVKTLCAGALAAGVLCGALWPALAAPTDLSRAQPGTTPYHARPWIEGYEPTREDALFRATYPLLPMHNVLKVYVSDADSYDAAGIRFSARVPHTMRDIDVTEMRHEAALLIKTAFDRFPDLQTVDVWATIPVPKTELTTVESTVFSVSADRATYQAVRDRDLDDEAFLDSFGKVWIAPQVPH